MQILKEKSRKKTPKSMIEKFNLGILREKGKQHFNNTNEILGEDRATANEVDKFIIRAIEYGSSDIHIEPERFFANIRFRVNGDLILFEKFTMEKYYSIVNRIKVLAGLDISNRLEPMDGKMNIKHENEVIDVRVSSIPTTNGEKLVLRVLYKDASLNNIKNLNFSNEQLIKFDKLIKHKSGMIIVNGPTGSGKSTTLYAILNEFDRKKLNICTVEDPVEFDMEMITQSNVNEKVGFTFSKALKYILRQDPDVILVGEIRDEETAKMAIRSAATGHKVLTTIHTNSGASIKSRLMSMGVDEYLLGDALLGIITQRLVRVLCDECKVKVNKDGFEYFDKNGCNKCHMTGYSGRTVVAEVIDLRDIDISYGDELIKAMKILMLDGKVSFDDYKSFKASEEF